MPGRSDDQETIEKFEDEFFNYIMVDGAHEYEPVKKDIIKLVAKTKK